MHVYFQDPPCFHLMKNPDLQKTMTILSWVLLILAVTGFSQLYICVLKQIPLQRPLEGTQPLGSMIARELVCGYLIHCLEQNEMSFVSARTWKSNFADDVSFRHTFK